MVTLTTHVRTALATANTQGLVQLLVTVMDRMLSTVCMTPIILNIDAGTVEITKTAQVLHHTAPMDFVNKFKSVAVQDGKVVVLGYCNGMSINDEYPCPYGFGYTGCVNNCCTNSTHTCLSLDSLILVDFNETTRLLRDLKVGDQVISFDDATA